MADFAQLLVRLDATTEQLRREMRVAEQTVDTSAGRINQSLGKVDTGFSKLGANIRTAFAQQGRFGLQNVAFQLQDVIVQVSAGTSVFRSLAQQLPQALDAFGPAGAIIGAVAAGVLSLGAAFFGMRDKAKEASVGVADLASQLRALGETQAGVDKVAQALAGLHGEAQQLGRVKLEIAGPQAAQQAEDARQKLLALAETIRATATAAEQAQRPEAFAVPTEVPPVITEMPAELKPLLELLAQAEDALRLGIPGAAARVVEALRLIDAASKGTLPALTAEALKNAEALLQSASAAKAVNEALAAKPPLQLARPGEGGPGGQIQAPAEAKFEQGLTQLARENALLKQGTLSRAEAGALLRAEQDLGRSLTATERERLLTQVRINDQLTKQGQTSKQAVAADFEARGRASTELFNELAEGGRVAVRAQRDAALESARAQEEAFRRVVDEWTRVADEQDRLRQGTASLQREFAAKTQPQDVISNLALGVNSEQTRILEQQAQLRDRGFSDEQIAGMQGLIQEQEDYNQKLAITNTVMGTVANNAAQLTETLLFEGADQAGEQLKRMLVSMAIQLAINLALATALNAMLGGAPTGAGAAAGGAGGAGLLFGAFPFGGGRAKGGQVRGGESYLVGEKGPEIFTPGQIGSVLPQAALPPSQPKVTVAPQIDFKVIDQRGAGAPPIQTKTETGPGGRQVLTAVVKAGLAEMQRSGELSTFLRQGYGMRPATR